MKFRCVWRPGDHVLLRDVTAEVWHDGAPLSTRVVPGLAEADVDEFAVDGLGSSSLRLVLTFKARVGAVAPTEVLRIDQKWNRSPVGIGLEPVFTAASYTVLTGEERRRRVIPGLHPLLQNGLLQGGWPTVVARVSLVDVTSLLPDFRTIMGMMAPRASGGSLASTPRILARTDGVLPGIWIVSTPHSCRGFAATDVLCFLGPSQNHGAPPPFEDQFIDPAAGALLRYAAVILGTGVHAGPLIAIDGVLADHFTPGNIILAKGLEKALVVSKKCAILAVPVPANRSHNSAATAALPGLLADVHRLIHAVGDAHPPLKADAETASSGIAAPQYALAAHSRGALAIYGEPDSGHSGPAAPTRQRPGALAAGPYAYSDVILFEGLNASSHTDVLHRTGTAHISFIGFENSTVTGPFNTLEKLEKAGPASRLHHFPVKTPPLAPNLTDLSAHSPSLAHALSTLPAIPTDVDLVRAILHQACTWSGDDGNVAGADEEHFLTQALKVSRLRGLPPP